MATLRRGISVAVRRQAAPFACPSASLAARHFATDTWKVKLNYQLPPPAGKKTGRYIDQPDKGDCVDEHLPTETVMRNGRQLSPPAALETMGFSLENWPTKVIDFKDDKEVESKYYEEIRNLVKKASGASRVLVFDHTVRFSENKNLNATPGGSAAPVPRVHCDYTANGAPRRLMQFGDAGIYSHLRGRKMTTEDFEELSKHRFAFINVWRSIGDAPVETAPLAMCDTNSVPESDHFLYELFFPNRTGENYSLRFNEAHKWYYYPKMVKDECLVFKVYDKPLTGPRFVFHTAFEDPLTTPSSPPRESIEIRTVAFFESDDLTTSGSLKDASEGVLTA